MFGGVAMLMSLLPDFRNFRVFSFVALVATTFTAWVSMHAERKEKEKATPRPEPLQHGSDWWCPVDTCSGAWVEEALGVCARQYPNATVGREEGAGAPRPFPGRE